jgi:hypothetical protein
MISRVAISASSRATAATVRGEPLQNSLAAVFDAIDQPEG